MAMFETNESREKSFLCLFTLFISVLSVCLLCFQLSSSIVTSKAKCQNIVFYSIKAIVVITILWFLLVQFFHKTCATMDEFYRS